MNKYLFLFTIGPVQSFIGQARKTQDLYAGSFLLSHLIGSAMKELESKVNNCEFIFPHKDIKSKPNRFIAEIESDDVGREGEYLKDFVETEFEDIAKIALDSLDINYDDDFKYSFLAQIKTHLQVNWVALPLEKDNYEVIYGELESYLGAIKNVRNFQQLEETGRKCSLCGERNILFYRLTDKETENGGLKVRKDGLLKKLYVKKEDVVFYEPEERDNLKMQKGEGLCAVCFTKRFADKYFEDGYEKSYPSTAKIALMDSLNNLDNGLLDEYKKMFGDNFDAELYFEDNLTEKYFERYENSLKKREDAKKHLREISEKARENKVTFSRYYAILMLDGDNMGKWLSGEFLEKKTELKKFHKRLSKELGDYAATMDGKESKNKIKEPEGKLVYAGGDDALAFINLNHLLPLMKGLREKFPPFEEFGFKIKGNNKSSPSVGIAIAHYKTPLSEVLKWARKMEHEAKENGGRDAFAIAVLKRSGGISKNMFKWQYGDSSSIEILEHLIKSLKPKEDSKQADFSNTFIKNLGMEFRRLIDEEGKYEEDIIKTEVKRLVERSCMMRRGEGETKEDFKNKKKQAIADLTEELDKLYTNSKSLDNFLSSLEIVDFLKRGGQLK